MTLSINTAFDQFRQKLEPSGLQKKIIAVRQKNVRDAMSSSLTVLNSFLTGSYSRETMIAPLSEADVDIFIVLDNRYYHYYNGKNGGQAGLIDVVKNTLKKTYPKTPGISRNGQAVTIRFTDFLVDVVPGFNRTGGGYIIPNSISARWISTDPKMHVEIFSKANQRNNCKLIPLIKMLKRWNAFSGQYLRSFHLEVLALEILDNVTIVDFSSGVRYFFEKAISTVTKQNFDPTGYGGDIGSYLDTSEKINTAKNKIMTAFEYATKAESWGRQGYIKEAINQWKKLFGDYFPNYG